MQRALNLKHFKTFVQQVKGAQVTEISVTRAEGPKGPRLKYSARDPRTRRLFNGEWILPRAAGEGPKAAEGGEASPPAGGGEEEFFKLAEKEFAVRRQDV